MRFIRGVIVKLPMGGIVAGSFNPYREWLGISENNAKPDYYGLLGVERSETDTARIAKTAEATIAKIRRIRPGAHVEAWSRLLDELAAAKSCLTNAEKRQAYDANPRTSSQEAADTYGLTSPTDTTPDLVIAPDDEPEPQPTPRQPATQSAVQSPWADDTETIPLAPQQPRRSDADILREKSTASSIQQPVERPASKPISVQAAPEAHEEAASSINISPMLAVCIAVGIGILSVTLLFATQSAPRSKGLVFPTSSATTAQPDPKPSTATPGAT